MPSEVVDTNVLVIATAAEQGWTRPRVPTEDIAVQQRVFQWLREFRLDVDRLLVMDLPERTILLEYKSNLSSDHFGRRVIQHKFDTGALCVVGLTYWNNGEELVADLPDQEADQYFHDLGDRKMVAAAFFADAPIVNATDGDWTEEAVVAGLELLGVKIVQILTEDERRACKERS